VLGGFVWRGFLVVLGGLKEEKRMILVRFLGRNWQREQQEGEEEELLLVWIYRRIMPI